MSRYEFKLPDIGEGVTEGEVVEWHVRVGDVVREDQPMVDVMTDKATVTITSPKAGTIAELHGDKGKVVKVHSVLVVFELGGDKAPASAAPAAEKKDAGPAATAVGDIKESLPGMGGYVATVTTGPAPAATPAVVAAPMTTEVVDDYRAPNGKPLATPATRKLARDSGVDLTRVRPTGKRQHVTKEDVRDYVARANGVRGRVVQPAAPQVASPITAETVVPPTMVTPAAVAAPAAPAATAAPAVVSTRAPVSIAPAVSKGGEALEERVPFAGVRKRIAERMAQSKHTAAHFTFVEECDVTALKALRKRMQPKAEARGVKLTFLPFFVKAVVAALKKTPILNSALDESTNEIVYRKYYNIGIAASTDAGLMVPVVKGADRRSLLDLAREIDRLGTDAKNGKVKLDDLQGGTFTITSLGQQGGLFATPIINFPEVAILGIHQMKQKPVVRDGQIVIGDVMLVSLSFDHRVVDGHIGAAFAYDIINFLQDPDSLLLEV